MSDDPGAGNEDSNQVPDAVKEWLTSVAAERGVSETELLRRLLSGGGPDAAPEATGGAAPERLEEEFRSLIDDVRDRVIQVKREADAKAPADHTHRDLNSSIEQLSQEIVSLDVEIEQLDDRVGTGFENYEDILTYLTDTTDEINRRLARLASTVIRLREQVGEASREEVRRTALAHLTQTANRHGVETAKCGDCAEAVNVGLLVEPRCPHCDSVFSSLEPKSGFFRKSVLHTGSIPALESAPSAEEESDAGLETLIDSAQESRGKAPSVEPDTAESGGSDAERVEQPAATGGEPEAVAPTGPTSPTAGEKPDGTTDLESVDGIGPAYADRLRNVGINGLRALAVADPEELGGAIGVPAVTVTDWVEQADARTGTS